MEIWIAVSDYPSYEVSSEGRVRRIRGGPGAVAGRVLRPVLLPRGYLKVSLYEDGVHRQRTIHLLVAAAFLPPQPTPRHQVNHRDGVKTHNAATNLEWATGSENCRHSYALGLSTPTRGELDGMARLTSAAVVEIRSLKGVEHRRVTANRFGISPDHVNRIQRGARWATSS